MRWRTNSPRDGGAGGITVRLTGLHVFFDELYNSVRICQVPNYNDSHVLGPVPPIVKGLDCGCWNVANDAFQPNWQTISILQAQKEGPEYTAIQGMTVIPRRHFAHLTAFAHDFPIHLDCTAFNRPAKGSTYEPKLCDA